jgi:hypothetical protein
MNFRHPRKNLTAIALGPVMPWHYTVPAARHRLKRKLLE